MCLFDYAHFVIIWFRICYITVPMRTRAASENQITAHSNTGRIFSIAILAVSAMCAMCFVCQAKNVLDIVVCIVLILHIEGTSSRHLTWPKRSSRWCRMYGVMRSCKHTILQEAYWRCPLKIDSEKKSACSNLIRCLLTLNILKYL